MVVGGLAVILIAGVLWLSWDLYRADVALARILEQLESRYLLTPSSSNTSSYWARLSRVSTRAGYTSSYLQGRLDGQETLTGRCSSH